MFNLIFTHFRKPPKFSIQFIIFTILLKNVQQLQKFYHSGRTVTTEIHKRKQVFWFNFQS